MKVQGIIKKYSEEYKSKHKILPHIHKAVNAIENCRTAELGMHEDVCDECGKIATSLEHNNVIPEGGTYYVGVTSTTIGDYTGITAIYTAGQNFPTTVNVGDVYVYGDYEYKYNYAALAAWETVTNEDLFGWGRHVLINSKASYGPILAIINGKETNMFGTFATCTALVDLSNVLIPKNITALPYTFMMCTSELNLSTLQIPDSVVNMEGAFWAATGLTDASNMKIPNKVTNLDYTFKGCSNLQKASKIPNNVTKTIETFLQCVALKSIGIPVGIKK